MNNTYKVYIHKFPNNKVYIGITKANVNRRWKNGTGYKTQSLMWKAIQKYGWGNIEHQILYDNLTSEEAKEKEKELIKQYKSNDSNYGYNITNGGDGVHGFHHNEETKRKLGLIWKGRHHTEETKKLMSEKAKGHKVNEKTLKALAENRKRIAESGVLRHPHKMTKEGRLAQRKNTCSALVQYDVNKKPIALWEGSSLVKELLNINPYNATKNFNLKAGGFYWKKCKDIQPDERMQIVFMDLKAFIY